MYKPPEGLYLKGRFDGWFFTVPVPVPERLIHGGAFGILRYCYRS